MTPIQYALLDKLAWDHKTERLQDCPGAVLVDVERLDEAVEQRTGRSWLLANGNITRKLRDGSRVYIAAGNRECGILVQLVT